MQLSHAGSKKSNVSSIIVSTNLNTINTLLGAVKQIIRLTCLGWKSNRVNYALILSNTLTAKVIIRQTLTSVFFGNIGSIINGILKSIKNSVIIESNQFV